MNCCPKSTINTLKSILDGWRNVIWESETAKNLAETRGAECAKCPENKLNICAQCGCWIPAKIRSETAYCPLDKW